MTGTEPDLDRGAGFTLIEVVISLLLLAIVSSAALGLFVRTLGSTDLQSQRQQAVELANQELETVRALPASSLVQGRAQADVQAIWTAASAEGLTSITADSVQLYDNSGASNVVPTVVTPAPVLDHVTYTLRVFVDRCYEFSNAAACSTSSATTGPSPVVTNGAHNPVPMIRVAVWVTWTPGGTRRCGTTSGACSYVTVTLIDPTTSDPSYNSN